MRKLIFILLAFLAVFTYINALANFEAEENRIKTVEISQ